MQSSCLDQPSISFEPFIVASFFRFSMNFFCANLLLSANNSGSQLLLRDPECFSIVFLMFNAFIRSFHLYIRIGACPHISLILQNRKQTRYQNFTDIYEPLTAMRYRYRYRPTY